MTDLAKLLTEQALNCQSDTGTAFNNLFYIMLPAHVIACVCPVKNVFGN